MMKRRVCEGLSIQVAVYPLPSIAGLSPPLVKRGIMSHCVRVATGMGCMGEV